MGGFLHFLLNKTQTNENVPGKTTAKTWGGGWSGSPSPPPHPHHVPHGQNSCESGFDPAQGACVHTCRANVKNHSASASELLSANAVFAWLKCCDYATTYMTTIFLVVAIPAPRNHEALRSGSCAQCP